MRLQWKCCKDRLGSETRAEWDYVEKTSKTEGEVIDAKRTTKTAKRLRAVDRRVVRKNFGRMGTTPFAHELWFCWGAARFGAC